MVGRASYAATLHTPTEAGYDGRGATLAWRFQRSRPEGRGQRVASLKVLANAGYDRAAIETRTVNRTVRRERVAPHLAIPMVALRTSDSLSPATESCGPDPGAAVTRPGQANSRLLLCRGHQE